jgi:hypothetical protein
MNDPGNSQSMSFSGGQFKNVQIGGQAGRDLNIDQTLVEGNDASIPDQAEAIDLVQQLAAIVQTLDLPDSEKQKAQRHLDMTREEMQQEEPDKPFALKNLQRATQVLNTASETVDAGEGLWQRVSDIVGRLAPWFGVAAKTLLIL